MNKFYGGSSKKDKKNEMYNNEDIYNMQQNVTASSANMLRRNGLFTNISDGFSENKPLIHKPDYSNKHNILHDNLGDTLLSENIYEYNIYIDSNDRNKITHYSPFEFKVNFGINGETPKIEQDFDNIKYINLNYVILPPTNIIFGSMNGTANNVTTTYGTDGTDGSVILDEYLLAINSNALDGEEYIQETSMGVEWPVKQKNSFTKNRYLILKIKELDNCRIKSTSCYSTTGIDKNSFVLFYDDDVKDENNNLIGTVWTPKFGGGSRVFLSSTPKSVKNFTISLCDQYGIPIIPIDNTLFISISDDNVTALDRAPRNGKGVVIPYLFPQYVYDTDNNKKKIKTSSDIDFINKLEAGDRYTYDSDGEKFVNISSFTYYTNPDPFSETIENIETQSELDLYLKNYLKSKPNLKSVAELFEQNFNMQLAFTFGVVESELNTQMKYYK